MSKKEGIVYILSDGTGETASAMTRAALVQYPTQDLQIVRCKNVRTEDQIEALIDEVFQKKGILVHTLASRSLREKVREFGAEKGVATVDLLGPLLQELDGYFHVENADTTAGLLRTTDERYFKRIEAIEFTVKHDC